MPMVYPHRPACRNCPLLLPAQSVAVRNHPAMRQIQHTIKAADLNIARAKRQWTNRDDWWILWNCQHEQFQSNRAGSISLNIRGPIYAGGNIPSVIRKAQAQKEAQVANLHVSKRKIEQATATSYALLDMARASRKATEEQIRASQVAFDGTKEEATLGARTTLDVLNAEQDLLNAKASLISHWLMNRLRPTVYWPKWAIDRGPSEFACAKI